MKSQSPGLDPTARSRRPRRRAILTLGALTVGMLTPAVVATSAAAADPTPISLVQPVYAATHTGAQPDLPSQVEVNTTGGGQATENVTWDLDGYSFADAYQTLTVYGSVDDTLTVSAQVEVVPQSTSYFVDSGMSASTPVFDSVKALAGDSLQNDVADQQYSTGSWGYVNDGNAYVAQHPGTLADKNATGLYALGSGGSSQPIVYKVPLDAGTYTITAGFQEWWNNREMKVSLVAASGATTVIAPDIKISANGSNGAATQMVSNQVTIAPADAGVAQLEVTINGQSGAPVLSWFGIAAGDVTVNTAPISVSAPTTDVAGGIYKTNQTVTLETATSGASIYYTTDGTDASRGNGTKYTAPITIDGSQTVKAIAFSNGTSSGQSEFDYDIEPDPGTYTSVPVGSTWYDTSGTPIQAHGGNILSHDGWYYWVGEDKTDDSTTFAGVSLYKSQDLKNWSYVQDILTPASAADLADCNIERPKLIYDQDTQTFVLWAHWERVGDYSASHLMVATSKTVDGDYTFLKDFRPGAGSVSTPDQDPSYTGTDGNSGYGSRDFTIYQDPSSGEAYLISTQNNTDMRVYKLIDGDTDVDWQDSYPLFVGDRREAPALVKVGEYYFLFTSSQSGWYPNQAMVSYTKNIDDPNGWSPLQPVGNNTTFYSQPTNILPLTGSDGSTSYIYMGDRWNANVLGASSYVWLPLDFTGTDGDSPSVSMKYEPGWSFDASTGTVTTPDDQLVSQDKPVEADQADANFPPSAANDGNLFNLNTSGDNTNYYLPTGVPYSWSVDLQQPEDLSRIDLSFRSYNGSETYNGYVVDGSNDDQTWTRLDSQAANKVVGFKSDSLSGKYRYVRVTVSKVVNDHNGSEADWAAGLVEVQVYAHPDTAAPEVDLTLSGDPVSTGWYTAAPTATVTASDAGSGVSSIEYRLGTSGPWAAYTAPVPLTDGSTVIQARATDAAGNVSDPIAKDLKVDTVGPTVTGAISAARELTLAGDDSGSGIDSVQYSLDGGAWKTYTDPVELDTSITSVDYRATDVAGNVSETSEEKVVGGSLTPSSVQAGGTVHVDATGFAPGEKVDVELHSTPVRLTTATADDAGTISSDVVIPADASVGNHDVVLTGSDSQDKLSLSLTVLAASGGGSTPTPTPTGGAGSNPTPTPTPTGGAGSNPTPTSSPIAGTGVTSTTPKASDSTSPLADTGSDVVVALILALLLLLAGAGIIGWRKRPERHLGR